MQKLKIAVLWHQHQPYYKKDDEFILPWVRMHGVKDYFDLAEILNEFPKIKQTFNIVPSMLLQLQEYIEGTCKDKIQRLTEIPSEELSHENKKEILQSFFLCNEQNMILPYPRYKELFEKSLVEGWALNNFENRDWRDLQVWYNLTWFGPYSRQKASVKRFFQKASDFTEEEKNILLQLQIETLKQIVPTLLELEKLKQVEISSSPMYHPILPLLINSEAMLEAIPDAKLPVPPFQHPEDATIQISQGIDCFKSVFGFIPQGMWPSEGSISDSVLKLFAESSIKWIASDEMILSNTEKTENLQLEKYFPIKFDSEKGSICIFFRDHILSDAIGFTYSNWNAADAVNDYLGKLRNIKNSLIRHYGEDIMNHAVVPVILDGENCWEFYPENGIYFLKELYGRLSESNEFVTVTMSEVITEESLNYHKPLKHIMAGSWINGDFRIWMGHKEHVEAWNILNKARNSIESLSSKLSKETVTKAMNEIYIAEGSDWFWWYGDSHFAPNKYDFDDLFRWHIKQVYQILGMDIPENVEIPINEVRRISSVRQPESRITPVLDGRDEFDYFWKKAGYYDAKTAMSVMHQLGEIMKSLMFCNDESSLFVRLDLLQKPESSDKIFIDFDEFIIKIENGGFAFHSNNSTVIRDIVYSFVDFVVLSLPLEAFSKRQEISLTVSTKTKDGEITYPRQGKIGIRLV